MKIGLTPPEGFQLRPPSAPPESIVRSSQPSAAPSLADALEHAAQPLEDALAGPEAVQTRENLLACVRVALARLRAISR